MKDNTIRILGYFDIFRKHCLSFHVELLFTFFVCLVLGDDSFHF